MRKYWPAVLIIAVAAIPSVSSSQEAQQAGAAKAAVTAEAAVGTAVADKALVGAAESFPTSAKVACFARILNAEGTEIEFVWYKGGAEQARVKQAVKGSPYRTWTTKTLPADAKGDWRCDVLQGETVLQSVKFKVE